MKISIEKNNHYNRINYNMLLLLLTDVFRKQKYNSKQMAKLQAVTWGEYEKIKQKRGIKKLKALQKNESDETFEEKNVEWFSLLDYTKGGNVRKTLKNKATILTNDPKLSAIVYNEQSCKVWLIGETPWSCFEKEFKEVDFVSLKHYFSKYYNLECSDKLYDAVLYVSKKRSFYPMKECLVNLPTRYGVKMTKEDVDRLCAKEKIDLC